MPPTTTSEPTDTNIDLIHLRCLECLRVRTYEVNIAGASALVEWMADNATPCRCGAKTCEVKARLASQAS